MPTAVYARLEHVGNTMNRLGFKHVTYAIYDRTDCSKVLRCSEVKSIKVQCSSVQCREVKSIEVLHCVA